MNVYDFDNTIYDGESVVDFFCFCISKEKLLCLYFPLVAYTAFLYKINKLSIEKLYNLSGKMVSLIANNKKYANEFIKEFWNKHEYKLKNIFLTNIKSEDIIITACPRQIIEGIEDKLGTKNIICSEFNLEEGKFQFACFRENKVIALKKQFPNISINEFYTDSMSDEPIMRMAQKSYLVKGKNIKLIKKSNLKRKS